MTDLKSLGLMLIEVADNGRTLQRRFEDFNYFTDWDKNTFNLDQNEYRLKPKVTYYRVYKFEGETRVLDSDTPLREFALAGHSVLTEHIKDFEVSE